jgi:hypothetical protein
VAHGVYLPPEQRPVEEIQRTIDLWSTHPRWPEMFGVAHIEGVIAMLRWGAGYEEQAPITRRHLGHRPEPREAGAEQRAAHEAMSSGRYNGRELPDPAVMRGGWLTGAENAAGWLAGDPQSLMSASMWDELQRPKTA